MPSDSSVNVSEVWNYAHGPNYEGGSYGDHVEEASSLLTFEEIVVRDKANLDIFSLKDDSLEDSENLSAPAVLAAEIAESVEAELAEFRAV